MTMFWLRHMLEVGWKKVFHCERLILQRIGSVNLTTFLIYYIIYLILDII